MSRNSKKSKILVFMMSLMMIFTCTNTSLFAFAGEQPAEGVDVQSEAAADIQDESADSQDNDLEQVTDEEATNEDQKPAAKLAATTAGELSPDIPYITASKTFVGLDKKDVPGNFKITIGGQSYGLDKATASQDGLTYEWVIKDKEAGTYTVSETGATFSDGSYILTGTEPAAAADPAHPASITTKPAEIVSENFTAKRHNSCSGGPYEIGKIKYLVASLSEGGGTFYIIWTADELSSTQRDAFIHALGKSSAGGQFGEGNMVSKYDNLANRDNFKWYSGTELNRQISYKGAVIQFDADGYLRFSATNAWKQFVEGAYEFKPAQGADIAITNTYEKNATSIPVEKIWKDGENQDGARPGSITANLVSGGKTIRTLTLDASNGWKGTFTDIPKYKDGKLIEYTVTEEQVQGYETEIKGSAAEGFKITNTHTPELTEVQVTKKWNDDDFINKTGYSRADSITIHLVGTAGDKEVYTDSKTVTANDNWKVTFSDLPKYNKGTEISYAAYEEPVTGFTPSATESDPVNFDKDGKAEITNTPKSKEALKPVSLTIIKVDSSDASNKLEGAVFTVTKKGSTEVLDTETTGANGEASFEFKATGEYTITEESAPFGYEKGETTSWDVEVVKGEVVSVSLEGGFWTKLYELLFGANTSAKFDKDSKTLTVPNTPETTSLEVTKAWSGEGLGGYTDYDKSDVTIYLTGKAGNETVYTDSKTVNANDNWKASFSDIPKYYNGTEITYTTYEDAVTGFTPSATKANPAEFEKGKATITNTPIVGDDVVDPTSLDILKVDGTDNSKVLPNATFTLKKDGEEGVKQTVVTNSEGEASFSFTSEGNYTIEETIAPEGYVPVDNASWKVTVVKNGPTIEFDSNSGKFIKHYQLQLKNSDSIVNGIITVPNTPVDSVIRVTKNVVMFNGDVLKVTGTYYVGLFEDEDLTKLAEMKPLEFQGESSRTVSFDVPAGKTYYIAETDADGSALLGTGRTGEEAVFKIEFDDTEDYSTSVVTESNTTKDVGFSNIYRDVPPPGAWEDGTVTVEKKVEFNGSAKAVTDTFYVTVFQKNATSGEWEKLYITEEGQDPELAIAKIELNNASTAKGTITGIPLGEYKVEETDANGNILENSKYVSSFDSNTFKVEKDAEKYTFGFILTNTIPKTSVSAEKEWNKIDGQYDYDKSSVTVQLLANGEEVEGQTLELNADNQWKDSFNDLPTLDENGADIEYSVAEVKITGFTSDIEENDGTFVITNTPIEGDDVVDPVTLNILKVDKATREALDGAVFTITKDGEYVGEVTSANGGKASFTFTEEGTYKVEETTPPEGYYIGEGKEWTVVVSKGEPTIEFKDGKFIKHFQLQLTEDMTENGIVAENLPTSITVTKNLKHNDGGEFGDDFVPEEASFYVALYSDSELTERVTEPKLLSYSGTSTDTVEFSKLPAGDYYVGETDAEGNLLQPIEVMTIDGTEYKVEMGVNVEGAENEVTTDMENDGNKFSFENIIYDIPDHKYTSLTLTKKVQDSKGNARKYSGTFYITLFTDAERTEIYKTVPVKLSNQTQATVELSVGEGKDIEPGQYWLAETDANGNIVDSEFKFTPSFDKDSFEITTDESVDVTLTNKGKPGNDDPFGPKTGDNANLPLPLMLMALVALTACAALFAGRRRRQDD